MQLFAKLIDRRIAAYQRQLIETHYQEVENMYRQMRGWRHDYRNHIQTMKVLASSGDLEGIRSYLDRLDTDLNTVDLAVKTGNAMADAILNSKISLAKSRDIPVQVDAHIPVRLKMSELDLCCVIGNLFDNAIEASLALPPEERPYDPEHLVGTCDSRRSIRYPEAFDRLGPPLLTSGGLLVMDELGFLENDAHLFQAAVLAALDGPVPVLAAIKPKETDFLRRVRQHPCGEVFYITPESREALYQRLRSRILQWNKEKL